MTKHKFKHWDLTIFKNTSWKIKKCGTHDGPLVFFRVYRHHLSYNSINLESKILKCALKIILQEKNGT